MARHRWLGIAVLIGPLAINPFGASTSIAQAKNAMFIHLAMGCLVWVVPSLWLRLVLGAGWLSFVLSGMPGFAFLGLLGLMAWAIFFTEAHALTDAQWHSLRLFILAAVAFQVLWMGVQGAGWDSIFVAQDASGQVRTDRLVPVQGWFSNPSDTVLFLGLSLPAVHAVHPILGLLVMIAMLYLHSSAGLLCIIVMALWAASRVSWRLTLLAGAGLAVLAVIHVVWLDPGLGGQRPLIYRAAAQAMRIRPWVGFGPNAVDYSIVFDTAFGRWNFIQNEWLQFGLETGVVGLGVVLTYTGWLLWRMASAWERLGELVPAVLILLAVSLFSIPFRIGPVALMAALYLGRVERVLRESA